MARRLILEMLLGVIGGGVPLYSLRDDFTTDAAAPLGNPLIADGTGQWVHIDTGNKVTKSGGALVKSGMTSGGTNTTDPREYFQSTRVGGRAFAVKANCSVDRMVLGWFNDNTADQNNNALALQTLSSGFFVLNPGTVAGSVNFGAEATSTDYQFMFVLFDSGGVIFRKGGDSAAWSILAIFSEGTAATVYATLSGFGVTNAYTVDTGRVLNALLSSAFQSASNLSTFTDTTLALGDNWTGAADAFTEIAFTLPAGVANDEAAILRFHWTDDNNCWKAYIKRNAGNTAWDMLVDSVSAGTPTNRLTVTGVGTPDLLRVRHVGSLIDCYTRAAGVYTKRGAQVNISFQNTTLGVEISGVAGTTLTRVSDYAFTRADYATEFDKHFL